jgi:hypothetical protein
LTDLAGEFYRGDGRGVNESLTVDAKGRFSFVLLTDDGQQYRNEGTAKLSDGRLALHPVNPDPHRAITGTSPPKLLPIRWGKRLYLLAEGEILEFCNAINLGAEPRDKIYGRFYIRTKLDIDLVDRRGPPRLEAVGGLPEIPKECEPFLIKRPLRGRVTEIEDNKMVRINLGARDGIRKGMDLWVQAERGFGFVTVVGVEMRSCTAEVKWKLFDDIGMFKVDNIVYSRIPDELKEGPSLLFGSFLDPKSELPPPPP